MEADGSNVHLGPVTPGPEAGPRSPDELVDQLRAEVSTQREHIAKINSMEPYAYLKATLVAIAYCHPAAKLDQLVFWAFNSASRCNSRCRRPSAYV